MVEERHGTILAKYMSCPTWYVQKDLLYSKSEHLITGIL